MRRGEDTSGDVRRVWPGLLVGAAFVAIAFLEWRRPLRDPRESRLVRLGRNGIIGAFSAAVVSVADRPVVTPVARFVTRRRWGLLRWLGLPPAVRLACGLVLLDYTLYVWHVLLHRVPLLWRFHVVHHIDRDLDALTAIRFHFGELLLSVPWRVAQVVTLGIDARTLSAWQTSLFLSVLFHHSNVRLPPGAERVVSRFVVTPRIHGIHHSTAPDEMNANWSSGLMVWDLLHRTAARGIPPHDVTIGVPGYQDAADVTVGRMLWLPFTRLRTDRVR